MNLTIRNIPEDVMNKLRTLSQIEKRSLNNEILLVLERGVQEELRYSFALKKQISKDTQVNIWKKLAKEWQDHRSAEEIIDDIYRSRTLGREFQL